MDRDRDMVEGEDNGPLFAAEGAKWRIAYKLYASSILGGICSIWFYRATHIPSAAAGEGRWLWLGIFGAEVWFGFYWIITQSVRWNPIYYYTNKEKLTQRFGSELPNVDIFVCTADPNAEPPKLVMSTILSVMAYDYPPSKLSIYLSDDAGSILTFYALWEVSHFAKHWLPYCRKFEVEPRSPQAYFDKCNTPDTLHLKEWSSMKKLYEEMIDHIDTAVAMGKFPEEFRNYKGFSKWNSEMTSRNHQSIVQILIDGRDERSTDMDGNTLPTLVYMAREKSSLHHHNFKAGAMNALIRVSSEISNGPIILNVDCDMYSNNSASIGDALCFFVDEKGQEIGYVQYPQYFANITENDLYANSFKVVNEVELAGFNHLGGPLYIGTGCFHRREALCGRLYSNDYKEDWKRGSRIKGESACTLEERASSLATCKYEHNTLWGKEIGLKYGCPVEDVITGLSIQCRGWKSICYNPSRRGFLGMAPTTLEQTLVQHKRWAEGNFNIFLSKNCSFIQGHGKIKLGLQMAYCIYGLWAPNSIPTLYYLVIPPLCLLKGVSLFPKFSSLWFLPFAYVILAKNAYTLAESLVCGDTFIGWWNMHRMWVLKRLTSYLYGTIDDILKLLGFSKLAFAVTTKVTDEDVSRRFEQEVIEFGSSSSMFVIIATVAMLNLFCLVAGLKKQIMDEGLQRAEVFLIQFLLSGVVVLLNVPIYEGLFLRNDKGKMPISVTYTSLGLALLACLLPIM